MNDTHLKYLYQNLNIKFYNELTLTLNYIDTFNTGKINSYHNSEHMKYVAYLALKFLENESVSESDKFAIIIAALFHDFDHSGGKFKLDKYNIQAAINGFNKFIDTSEDIPNINQISPQIIRLIQITEYPCIYELKNVLEKALHDADYLYPMYLMNPQIALEYLRSEMQIKDNTHISKDDMLVGTIDFVKNKTTLFTEAGKKLYNDNIARYIIALTNYIRR